MEGMCKVKRLCDTISIRSAPRTGQRRGCGLGPRASWERPPWSEDTFASQEEDNCPLFRLPSLLTVTRLFRLPSLLTDRRVLGARRLRRRHFPSCGLREGLRSQAAGHCPAWPAPAPPGPGAPEKACSPQPGPLGDTVRLLSSSEPWTWPRERALALDRPASRACPMAATLGEAVPVKPVVLSATTALQAERSQLLWTGFWFPGFRAVFGGPAPTHSPTPVGSAPCSWEVTTLPEGCRGDRPRRP